VDPAIVALVENMKPWVEESNARTRLEQAEGAQDEETDDRSWRSVSERAPV
jgi:hypothetical protein